MFISLRSMCNRLKLGACVFGCWIELLLCCMCVDSGKNCQSRPGELVSPRRERLRLTQVLLEQLVQAKGPCLWAMRCLAQARVPRPSEFSKEKLVCSVRSLVQARCFIFGRRTVSPRRAGLAQARCSQSATISGLA